MDATSRTTRVISVICSQRPKTLTLCSALATCRAAPCANWGAMRKLISRGGSAYARRVLGIKVRDLTGGFKCIRRSVLEAIDLTTLRGPGRGLFVFPQGRNSPKKVPPNI